MKKAIKKTGIFLVVFIIINSILIIPFCAHSMYPSEIEAWCNDFRDTNYTWSAPLFFGSHNEYFVFPWKYFSKEMNQQYIFQGGISCRYLLKKSGFFIGELKGIEYSSDTTFRTSFTFGVDNGIRRCYSPNLVNYKFYSREELALYQAGVEYEIGKNYMVFYNIDKTANFFTGDDTSSVLVFAPLDGEYPYIELYPDGTRYDATYFGAESKYVEKEEFVRLVGVAMEKEKASSPSLGLDWIA